MTTEQINYNSNMAYLVGYYEARIKMLAIDIETGNLESSLNDIKATLEMGQKIWDNKYEKHYTQIK
jgi:hypothetical protein